MGAAAKTTPVAKPKIILPITISGKYGMIDIMHPIIINILVMIIGFLLPLTIREPPITDPIAIPKIPPDARIVLGDVTAL